MERVIEAAERIRRLEVQGATEVALTAVRALVEQMAISTAADRASALVELAEAKSILSESRETEPLMRNLLRYVDLKVREERWETIDELTYLLKGSSDELLRFFSEARDKIGEIGSRRILPGMRILTHCHSSAVNTVLRLSKARGTDFEVTCTETRPAYQGRRTARELLEQGIKTTMIVDSAIRAFINEVDLVLVGSDAITSEGNIVNKIGTSLIALAAHEARVPFYVVAELLKFDPQTLYGEREPIEERPASEVWPDSPEGIVIRNPAFDVTRREYIHGIICEEGVISPHSVLEAVRRRYPWILGGSHLSSPGFQRHS